MSDDRRLAWARALTTAGWLFTFAYLTFVASTFRRAFSIERASFEDGVWGQRIETMSFVSLPQNVIVLVPAAACAVGGLLLLTEGVDDRELWLAQLRRVVAGVSYVVIGLALLGIVALFFRSPDSVSDFGALLGRVGGALMATAMLRVCLEPDRVPRS